MVSFITALLRYRKDDSAFGDLARDVEADRQVNRKWNVASLRRHMIRMGACERALGTLSEVAEALAVEICLRTPKNKSKAFREQQ